MAQYAVPVNAPAQLDLETIQALIEDINRVNQGISERISNLEGSTAKPATLQGDIDLQGHTIRGAARSTHSDDYCTRAELVENALYSTEGVHSTDKPIIANAGVRLPTRHARNPDEAITRAEAEEHTALVVSTTNHADLLGLVAPADDHTQYALLAGRHTSAGAYFGQTLNGGTDTSDWLFLGAQGSGSSDAATARIGINSSLYMLTSKGIENCGGIYYQPEDFADVGIHQLLDQTTSFIRLHPASSCQYKAAQTAYLAASANNKLRGNVMYLINDTDAQVVTFEHITTEAVVWGVPPAFYARFWCQGEVELSLGPSEIAVAYYDARVRTIGGTANLGGIWHIAKVTSAIAAGAITSAMLRDSVALSVIGRSANSSGVPGDIAAVAASDAVLRESGSVLGFGTVATGGVADKAITLAKMADVDTSTVFYRQTAGTGVPEVQLLSTLKTDLGLTGTNTGDQTITLTGDVTGSGTGTFAATIAADAVTYAKMQNVSATDKLLGRSTAGAGDVEEIACVAAVRTWFGTPSSANLAAAVTEGRTGTGALVCAAGDPLFSGGLSVATTSRYWFGGQGAGWSMRQTAGATLAINNGAADQCSFSSTAFYPNIANDLGTSSSPWGTGYINVLSARQGSASSTDRVNVGGRVYSLYGSTVAGAGGATEYDLISHSLAAYTFGSNSDEVVVTALFRFNLGVAQTGRVKLYFGTTVIWDSGIQTALATRTLVTARIWRSSDAASTVNVYASDSMSYAQTFTSIGSVSFTSANTIKGTGINSTTGEVLQEALTIDWYPVNS